MQTQYSYVEMGIYPFDIYSFELGFYCGDARRGSMLDRIGIAGLMMIRLEEHGYPRFFIVLLSAHADAAEIIPSAR